MYHVFVKKKRKKEKKEKKREIHNVCVDIENAQFPKISLNVKIHIH